MKTHLAVSIIAAATGLTGCISATPPGGDNAVKAIPVDSATAGYWLKQSTDTTVADADYDRLWNACDTVSHNLRFSIERNDYRDGVMTTVPLTSKQYFEPWRHDVQTIGDLEKSSLATFRRTIRYELSKRDTGGYQVAVRVLVERSSSYEHRATTAIEFNEVFDGFPKETKFYSDDGKEQPQQAWYAVGRDAALEAEIGRRLTDTLSDATK